MCGIVGYVSKRGASASLENVKAMATMIKHRGPDGEGFYIRDSIGLGHVRLAIIDLSEEANQPIKSENGRYVMVYNGEIYNFKELRRELVEAGYTFKTEGDSEVIVNGFDHWGSDLFKKLNGMFALAIFDNELNTLTLARDRFGVKPLYYLIQNGQFVFGSEAKAFRAHPDIDLELNPHGLAEYLTFMNFLSDQTLFKGVRLFPAGHYVQLKLPMELEEGASLATEEYWDFRFTGDNEDFNKDEIADEIAEKFEQAVIRQLISDVGVSSYLSGGVDSGSITAVTARNIEHLKTFTAYFDYEGASKEERAFDERDAARLMSNTFDTTHVELPISPADFNDVARTTCYFLDEPRVGQSYPNYLISGAVREHETVTLSGAGGDELFGGYPWRYFQGFPADSFQEFCNGYFSYWRRIAKTDEELEEMLEPFGGIPEGFDARSIFDSIFPDEAWEAETAPEFLNWCLYFEAKTFLNGLLVVEDKVAMAHGLETRVPFLDNDLVDLACRIPIQAKLDDIDDLIRGASDRNKETKNTKSQRHSGGKSILRHMMRRLVPAEIANRDKQGFSAPDATWFANQCYEFIRSELIDKPRQLHEFLNKEYLTSVVEGHRQGTRTDGRHKIWAFLNLAETIDNFELYNPKKQHTT